jgi:shikimate kinase
VVQETTNTNLAPIVLIGLMGAGKTSVGRCLALRLDLNFIDADDEIVKAAGCSIPEIFDVYGEKAFRDVEERVIKRLIGTKRIVLATGGGAYMANNTRSYIKTHAISVWLRADLKTLVDRTSKRMGRPLLNAGSPHNVLKNLMDIRYPIYADANIIVDSGQEGIEVTVDKVVIGLSVPRQDFKSKTSQ